MPPRYRYNRMTAADLSADLDELDISAGQLARLCGAQHKRVIDWLKGKEDIPPHIPVLMALLYLPEGMATARGVAESYILPGEEATG